jgi:hypothetical protein
MIEEEFYASVKLVSGEEVLALITVCDEEDRTLLLMDNPIIIKPVTAKNGMMVGYKVEPWLNIPDDGMYMVDMKNVMYMSEVKDREVIEIHLKYSKASSKVPIDRTMGFLSKVNEARQTLEKAYKNS